MENNYYTPEITEFRIGFELENISDTIMSGHWNKIVLTQNWMYKILNELRRISGSEWATKKYMNSFRVKYLDVQDFEELGFTCRGYNKSSDFFEWDYRPKDIRLCILPREKYIIRRGNYYFYCGTILNKSELLWILKRIKVL